MIKCNSCSTSMVLDRTEAGPKSNSAWYECPLCGKVRLTCSKTGTAPTIGKLQNGSLESAADFIGSAEDLVYEDIAEYRPAW